MSAEKHSRARSANTHRDSSDHGTVRIIHITDPHLFADTEDSMRGINTFQSLQLVVDHAAANHNADAWLVTGDIAQDETEQAYQNFRQALLNIDTPVLCLPGNHDNPDLMHAILDTPPWGVLKNLAIGDWCICPVDSRVDGKASGHISQTNLDQLDLNLRQNTHLHCLVALHHQALEMGSRWLDSVGLANHRQLTDMLERHPTVRGVVWGHVHQASDRTQKNIRFLSTPSTCAQFLPDEETFALDKKSPGYRWLDLRPDGTFSTGVVWVTI